MPVAIFKRFWDERKSLNSKGFSDVNSSKDGGGQCAVLGGDDVTRDDDETVRSFGCAYVLIDFLFHI